MWCQPLSVLCCFPGWSLYLAGRHSVCGKGHTTGMQGSTDGLGQPMEGFTVILACTYWFPGVVDVGFQVGQDPGGFWKAWFIRYWPHPQAPSLHAEQKRTILHNRRPGRGTLGSQDWAQQVSECS